jgi:peptidyl-prolyl cis-trans isomerase B (cyclophilin B)
LVVRLEDPSSGEVLGEAEVEPGAVDLSALFPVIWTTRSPRVVYAQLYAGGEGVGGAVVLQPVRPPVVAESGLTRLGREAATDAAAAERLAGLSATERAGLAREVVWSRAEGPVQSGVRTYVDRLWVMETSVGTMVFRLRPDEAPETVWALRGLIEQGFYDGTPFHRVVARDGAGRPFIVQGGDPTGTGLGGPGFRLGFEPSGLAHGFGVLSLARRPGDPNSGGSQFFVCLSRAGCAGLDGLYVGFGELVDGGGVLVDLASVPVGPRDPDDPRSVRDRPLDPPVIERSYLREAFPLDARRPAVREAPEEVIVRCGAVQRPGRVRQRATASGSRG